MQVGTLGTPAWSAPEVLKRESPYRRPTPLHLFGATTVVSVETHTFQRLRFFVGSVRSVQSCAERVHFIDNLLVRIHHII